MKIIWNWLLRLLYYPDGRTKKTGFIFISIPVAIGLVGHIIFDSWVIWGVGIALQILTIILIIAGAKKTRHSQKNVEGVSLKEIESTEGKIIKKGTDEWWTWVGMLKVAEKERKRLRLSSKSAVTITVGQCNEYLQGLNWIKRLWLLFTIEDLHPVDREKLGSEVAIKAEDGIVHQFFKGDK